MNYNFTNTGSTVIIKAKNAMTLGSKKYVPSEPICSLSNVFIDIVYAENEKDIGNKFSIASAYSAFPDTITIRGAKNQDGILNLIFEPNDVIIYKEDFNLKLNSVSKQLILPVETDSKLSNIFVYDINKNKMDYSISANIITIAEDGEYYIFYQMEKKAIAALVAKVISPTLFELAIETKGNINGETGYLITHVPCVRISTKPTIQFSSVDPFAAPLVFQVLKNKEEPIKCYFSQ